MPSVLTDVRWTAFLVAALGAVALAIAAVLGRRALAAAVGPVRPGTLAAVATLAGVHAWLVVRVVPAGPWHSFHHDVERWGQLLDTGVAGDVVAASMHGPTGFVLLRAAMAVVPDPFLANAALSVLATAVGFAAAKALLEDDHRALLVTAVHALLPVRLRVAPSLQLYVAAELALIVALLAAVVHLKDGRARSFVPAVIALALAMTSHLEMLVVAPVAVLALVLATDPGWLLRLARSPGRLGGLALLVLLVAPRLAVILTGPDGLLPGRPAPGDPKGEIARRLLLGVLATLSLLALVRPPVPDRPWVRRGLGVAAVVAAIPGLALLRELSATPFAGVDRAPTAMLPWSHVHALLSPERTPPPWGPLALVGLLGAVATAPRVVRFVAPTLLATAWLHAAHADTISTAVRIALVAAWPFSLAVGLALAAIGELLPSRLRPVLALLPLAALQPYVSWIGWRYPEHREFAVLELARAHAAAGGTVILPTADDFPPTPADDVFERDAARGYLRVAVGPEAKVLGLREAAALASLPPDAMLVWPVGCQEAIAARHDPVGDPHIHLLLGDRTWSWRGRVGIRDPFRALAPCWYQSELATCDVDDVTPCPRWVCAAPPPDEVPRYADPACEAVRTRFPWTTVREEPLVGPSLTGALLDPHAVVGAYRLGSP